MENKTEALKGEDLMLHYKIYQPEGEQKMGLILLLHGVNSNENDLFRLAKSFPSGFIVVSARAPYTLDRGKYAWFELSHVEGKPVINPEQAEKSRQVINTFISQLIERYSIDKTKVFLGGFSQGGIMSYSVGLTYPQKLAGIFILSSRLLPEVKPLIRATDELKKLPIFIAHGKGDTVLPLAYAKDAITFLQTITDNYTYYEYDINHTIGGEELMDLINWLSDKSA